MYLSLISSISSITKLTYTHSVMFHYTNDDILFKRGIILKLRNKRVGKDYQRTVNEGKGEQTKDHHTRTGRLGYGGTA